MKTTLWLALLTTFCHIVSAQYEKPRDINFDVSTPYEVVDARVKIYFYAKNKVMAIKVHRGTLIVQRFDEQTMKEVGRNELEIPDKTSLVEIREFSGKYLVFYSLTDKDADREELYYREIDFNTGKWLGHETQILTTYGKLGYNPSGSNRSAGGHGTLNQVGGNGSAFSFEVSNDGNKLLIQYRKAPKIRKDSKSHDEIGLHVFSETMEKIWGSEETMPYTEKQMNNIAYAIDKEGNAYILSTVYEDDAVREAKKDSRDEPNYHIELMKRTPLDEGFDISKISVNGKLISQIDIFESPEDKIVLAGYYRLNHKSSAADGVFHIKVDKAGNVYDEQSYEIPLELLNQYEGKKTKKRNTKAEQKGGSAMSNLRLREVYFEKDGGLIIIGEQYYSVTTTHQTPNGGTTRHTTYYYADILVAGIKPDGELGWMRKLPKHQYGSYGLGGMSYKHIAVNGLHYFLYADNPANLALPFDQAPFGYKDKSLGQLTAYIVETERGEVSKVAILDMEDADGTKLYQFSPARIIATTDNHFVLEAYKKKKKDVMIKISIEE